MFTKDPQFWQAMRNTLWIIAVGLPPRDRVRDADRDAAHAALRRGHRVYRTVYFLPTLAPAVAAALAFVFILNPSFGP
jgi:multiple sugar transport system permease protein